MSPGDAELQGLSGIPRWNLVRFPVAFACWRLNGFVGITVQAVQQYPFHKAIWVWGLIFQALFPPSAGQWLKACQGTSWVPTLVCPSCRKVWFPPRLPGQSQRPIYIETEKWSQTHVFPNSKSRNICSVSSSPHPIIIAQVFPVLGSTRAREVFLDTKLGPCKAKLCFFISGLLDRPIHPCHPASICLFTHRIIH